MANDSGISVYPEVESIYRNINHLMTLPAYTLKRDAMEKYLKHFDEKCSKSKEMIVEAKKYIPGGVQHNLAFNYPFPLVITKAEGAYLYDIDGNRYIDFLQAGGPTILGSNYTPVKEKAVELINECGPSTGLFHEYEYKIAELICKHFPSVDMFRMLGSGTEAVMAAIRIARLATGKKKVIKMGGAYHGWSDPMVYDLKIPGTRWFEAHGIPSAARKHTQAVYPNDIGALRKKLQMNRILHGGTAAVILEGIGPESGTRPVDRNYNKQVRELCDEFGALLIMDEVVTAFRLGLGGAQAYFEIEADLTVFGKVVAGGYPAAGGIGGRRELMEYVAAGLESGKKRAYVGGTMAANPLSSVAGYFTLLEIEKNNASVKAGQAGDRVRKGLQELIDDRDLPFVTYNTGSIAHLETVAPMFLEINILKIKKVLKDIKVRKFAMEEYGAAFMAEGIVTLAGSRLYTSMATTNEVVDDALSRFAKVFDQVEKP